MQNGYCGAPRGNPGGMLGVKVCVFIGDRQSEPRVAMCSHPLTLI